MKNAWLESNIGNITKMKKTLTEMEYLPILQDFPVRWIQHFMNGMETEITKLQKEVNELREENKKLKTTDTVDDINP
jgi:HAMP domain-containing protein